jgi:hypothetical protein
MLPVFRRRLKLPELSDSHQILLGKVMTFVLGMLVTVISFYYSRMQDLTIFDMLLNVTAFFMLPMLIPMLLCLFIRKTASWAVFASMLGGFLPSLANRFFGLELSYQARGLAVCLCSVAGYVVSVFFYGRSSEEYRERCREFYARMFRPVDFEREVGGGTDYHQLKVIGLLAIVTGVLLLLLLLVPNGGGGRICILSISGFILAVGLLMRVGARRVARREEG